MHKQYVLKTKPISQSIGLLRFHYAALKLASITPKLLKKKKKQILATAAVNFLHDTKKCYDGVKMLLQARKIWRAESFTKFCKISQNVDPIIVSNQPQNFFNKDFNSNVIWQFLKSNTSELENIFSRTVDESFYTFSWNGW